MTAELSGRWHRLLVATAGTLILAVAAAACSSSGSASASGQTSLSPADREKALLQFAQCMRKEGVDIPDPTVDANGNVRIQRPRGNNDGAGPEASPDPAQRDKFQTARDACNKYLKGVNQGFNQENRAQFQDNALKFAQCMRGEGVDVPDPNFNATPSPGSGGRGGGPFGNLNRDDPKVSAALDKCRTQVFGTNGGPGGFGFGGGRGGN